MKFVHEALNILREMSGLFLALTALWMAQCAAYLRKIKGETECLHHDFDFIHEAHGAVHVEGSAMQRRRSG